MTYDRVNWQNEPSENTPISAENLNKMDSAIKTLSEMVEANPVEADTDELKKIGIEGTIYKIAGGHELVNSSGSTMTQRSKMEFLDTHLTDDSVNNTTKVEVVKEVTTAQFANETERGLYRITDKPDSVINAEQVAYDSDNSVKDMIDSEKETLITGLNISRSGKNRILQLGITLSAQLIHTLATKDRPIFTVTGMGRYKDTSNTYYPCLITVEDNGNISASYFNGTTVSGIANGTIVGNVSYMAN